MSEKTIFKKIIDGEIPADLVYADDQCLAVRDVNPQAPTHVLIIARKEILVQPNCETAEPRPPAALIEVYGVRAQMLAPVMGEDAVIGWVSVHETRGQRNWTAHEAIEAGCRGDAEQTSEFLDAIRGSPNSISISLDVRVCWSSAIGGPCPPLSAGVRFCRSLSRPDGLSICSCS